MNIKILKAGYIYQDGEYICDSAIAFDKKIIKVDLLENLKELYPQATVEILSDLTVIYPGFINTHTHLEFSANKTTLEYGSFVPWLYSVIKSRDELINSCDDLVMSSAINDMLRSGITSFGAISSYGSDLQSCIDAPQRVVFFNELIGSDPKMVDVLYNDFLERLNQSSSHTDSLVTPAIAIHSPYSVHPIVAQKAINLAKHKKLTLSTHFMESKAEKEWLDKNEGDFKEFFSKFLSQNSAVTSKENFLNLFDNYSTHLVHATQIENSDIKKIAENNHTIAHCPRSNRFLGTTNLPLKNIIDNKIKFTTATDGLSSNYSLNIFEELKSALMIHSDISVELLADELIKSVTKNANEVLNLNSGELKEGYNADIITLTLPDIPSTLKHISLWSILHTKEVDNVFIAGKKVL